VSTAPTFREDCRLKYNWDEEPLRELVTVFDPMEAPENNAVEEDPGPKSSRGVQPERIPEPPISPEGLGSPEEPESPTEDVIVVETGDHDPEDHESIEEQEPKTAPRGGQRGRRPPKQFQSPDTAYSAIQEPEVKLEKPKIPQTEAKALDNPLWKAAIEEELTKINNCIRFLYNSICVKAYLLKT
jgi:hypothetical protein